MTKPNFKGYSSSTQFLTVTSILSSRDTLPVVLDDNTHYLGGTFK